jgi:hypothetical protein
MSPHDHSITTTAPKLYRRSPVLRSATLSPVSETRRGTAGFGGGRASAPRASAAIESAHGADHMDWRCARRSALGTAWYRHRALVLR